MSLKIIDMYFADAEHALNISVNISETVIPSVVVLKWTKHFEEKIIWNEMAFKCVKSALRKIQG